jgi:hypothetical protein
MDSLTRDRLLLRAGYRCEYCRTRLLGTLWEVEHIVPESRGGSDELNNLAVACPRCNRNKKDRETGVDFVTGKTSRLFNPRNDQWDQAFGAVAGHVVGKTEIGRATAQLLFKQTDKQVPQDLNWWPLQNLQSETLYDFLNHQRGRRLGNKFAELERGLTLVGEIQRSKSDDAVATFAHHLLLAESLFTRSRPQDVLRALDVLSSAEKLPDLDLRQRAELLNITSIVLQQLATVLYLEGSVDQASLAQERAVDALAMQLALSGQGDLKDTLRLQSMAKKFSDGSGRDLDIQVCAAAADLSREGVVNPLAYAIDDVVVEHPGKAAERLLHDAGETLLAIGYGQDFDYANGIVLRRRWWILSAVLSEVLDLDLLNSDIQLWLSVGMQNEVRELAAALHRLLPHKRRNVVEMLAVIQPHLRSVKAKRTKRNGEK